MYLLQPLFASILPDEKNFTLVKGFLFYFSRSRRAGNRLAGEGQSVDRVFTSKPVSRANPALSRRAGSRLGRLKGAPKGLILGA